MIIRTPAMSVSKGWKSSSLTRSLFLGQSWDGFIHSWDRKFTLSEDRATILGMGSRLNCCQNSEHKCGHARSRRAAIVNFNMDTKEIYLEEISNFDDSSNEEEKFDDGTIIHEHEDD